jgi:hypothetical protein
MQTRSLDRSKLNLFPQSFLTPDTLPHLSPKIRMRKDYIIILPLLAVASIVRPAYPRQILEAEARTRTIPENIRASV